MHSEAPTRAPTRSPSRAPATNGATESPTKMPSEVPTGAPTRSPSRAPTKNGATASPTKMPTETPNTAPRKAQSNAPTEAGASASPAKGLSTAPSRSPSTAPSKAPSQSGATWAPTTHDTVHGAAYVQKEDGAGGDGDVATSVGIPAGLAVICCAVLACVCLARRAGSRAPKRGDDEETPLALADRVSDAPADAGGGSLVPLLRCDPPPAAPADAGDASLSGERSAAEGGAPPPLAMSPEEGVVSLCVRSSEDSLPKDPSTQGSSGNRDPPHRHAGPPELSGLPDPQDISPMARASRRGAEAHRQLLASPRRASVFGAAHVVSPSAARRPGGNSGKRPADLGATYSGAPVLHTPSAAWARKASAPPRRLKSGDGPPAALDPVALGLSYSGVQSPEAAATGKNTPNRAHSAQLQRTSDSRRSGTGDSRRSVDLGAAPSGMIVISPPAEAGRRQASAPPRRSGTGDSRHSANLRATFSDMRPIRSGDELARRASGDEGLGRSSTGFGQADALLQRSNTATSRDSGLEPNYNMGRRISIGDDRHSPPARLPSVADHLDAMPGPLGAAVAGRPKSPHGRGRSPRMVTNHPLPDRTPPSSFFLPATGHSPQDPPQRSPQPSPRHTPQHTPHDDVLGPYFSTFGDMPGPSLAASPPLIAGQQQLLDASAESGSPRGRRGGGASPHAAGGMRGRLARSHTVAAARPPPHGSRGAGGSTADAPAAGSAAGGTTATAAGMPALPADDDADAAFGLGPLPAAGGCSTPPAAARARAAAQQPSDGGTGWI